MNGRETVSDKLWQTVEDGIDAAIILARSTITEALEHDEPKKRDAAIEFQRAALHLSNVARKIPRRQGGPPRQNQRPGPGRGQQPGPGRGQQPGPGRGQQPGPAGRGQQPGPGQDQLQAPEPEQRREHMQVHQQSEPELKKELSATSDDKSPKLEEK